MPWVRLDDSLPLNSKTRAVTVDARWLYVTSLCWSAIQQSDGIIPASDIHAVAALAGVAAETAQQLLPKLWHPEGFDCEACAEVGQLNPVPPGHVAIHCYLERNESRAQRNTRLRKDRERKKPSGTESGRKPPRQSGRNPPVPSRPVPTGDLSSRRPGNSRGEAPLRPDDDELSTANGQFPGEVWVLYAERKLARQPPGKVENTTAWKLKTAENARLEHEPKAGRWWHEFDVSAAQLADALIADAPPAAHYRRKDRER